VNLSTSPNVQPGALRSVLRAIATAHNNQARFALSIVIATSGATYRKPGALIVTDINGEQYGWLSGGCLESELTQVALQALADDTPRIKTFDSRSDDDLLFGSGSGCRGYSKVLVLPIEPRRDATMMKALISLDTAQGSLKLATVHTGSQLGCTVGALDGQTFSYRCPDGALPTLRDLCDNATHQSSSQLSDDSCVSVLRLAPPPHLWMIGAGPEAPSVIRLAHEVGWYITVTDHRQILLNTCNHADQMICTHPAAALAQAHDQRIDAALVMNHHATHDLDALCALATMRVPHIALLGPRTRRDELLQRLTDAERASLLPRLQAPAGLALGGEGPEAIALSMVAGLPFSK
jgi:xanthine dehydrogenase accessory factor